MSVTKYTTESGDVYIIDSEHKTWKRIRENKNSFRNDSGTYKFLLVSTFLSLLCPPINKDPAFKGYLRIINSTKIVKVEELE